MAAIKDTIIAATALFALNHFVICPLALNLERLDTLAKHFGMVRPWLACSGHSKGHRELLKSGINGRSLGIVANISSLLGHGDIGQSYPGQSAIICLDDYFKSSNVVPGTFGGKAIGHTWILGKFENS